MRWQEILAVGVVLIIVMAAFVLLMPYIFPGAPPPGAPSWHFKGWWQFNRQVDTAVVGHPVTLQLEIVGQAVSVGTLKIEIKKDIPLAPDVVVHTDSKPLSLVLGQTVQVNTTFTPDKPTDTAVREYFFKLYWNDVVIYDPTIPGQRYGLKVTEVAVTYQGGEFEG